MCPAPQNTRKCILFAKNKSHYNGKRISFPDCKGCWCWMRFKGDRRHEIREPVSEKKTTTKGAVSWGGD